MFSVAVCLYVTELYVENDVIGDDKGLRLAYKARCAPRYNNCAGVESPRLDPLRA